MQDFQADFDLVAECASTAIRSPAEAKMPATYATEVKHTVYPRATLPENLPLPKGAKMVEVPDVSGCSSWVACSESMTRVGLVAQQQFASLEAGTTFKVLSLSPPRGTSVPEGTVVTIITQPMKIDPRYFLRLRTTTDMTRLAALRAGG